MQNFAGPIWSEHPDLDADLAIALGGPSSQRWAGRTKIQVPIYHAGRGRRLRHQAA